MLRLGEAIIYASGRGEGIVIAHCPISLGSRYSDGPSIVLSKTHQIRDWYQANINRTEAAKSRPYIASLPPVEEATRDQMIDAMQRVISRDLEWAYHESDGKYKMAAYAHAALDSNWGSRT